MVFSISKKALQDLLLLFLYDFAGYDQSFFFFSSHLRMFYTFGNFTITGEWLDLFATLIAMDQLVRVQIHDNKPFIDLRLVLNRT